MSIRPIDLQVVVQKTQEIHSAKQSVVNKLENEQLRMQDQNNMDRARQQKLVQKTESIKNNRIDARQREAQDSLPQKKKQPKKRKEHEEQGDESLDPRGRRFDVRI
ncbi:MAG: hypothetical protein Q4A52_05420 [Bacillota bacterium]|nr:hypothetical protein [Bacillota bacterium]